MRKAVIATIVAGFLAAPLVSSAHASWSCDLQEKLGIKNVMACEGPPDGR